MRTFFSLAVAIVAASVMSVCAQDQETVQKEPSASPALQQAPPVKQKRMRPAVSADDKKRSKQIPSIIQSELERSRSEEKQQKTALAARSASSESAQKSSTPSPLWPVAISVLIAGFATAAIIYFFFLRNHARFARPARRPVSSVLPQAPDSRQESASARLAAAPEAESGIAAPERTHTLNFGGEDEDDIVTSASPYASEEENEMPEAALTMNLINKKRETKKELIQEVMRRVQRKEKPQQIAEALRVGIGEVELAMTLMKLKK